MYLDHQEEECQEDRQEPAHNIESEQSLLLIYFIGKNVFFFKYSLNPSSPKRGGGLYQPPNGFRPGAQNRTAKG